jgi:hypothetical protein
MSKKYIVKKSLQPKLKQIGWVKYRYEGAWNWLTQPLIATQEALKLGYLTQKKNLYLTDKGKEFLEQVKRLKI